MIIHPELASIVNALPAVDWMSDLEWSRQAMRDAAVEPPVEPPVDGRITVAEQVIPGGDGQELRVRVYRPAATAGARPAVVWCHGGGFVLGDLGSEDANCRLLAGEQQLTVISPDYRLAPEHPYPAGFDDCYATLSWVEQNAGELDVSAAQLAVGGHSAGGALAAGVALAARDRQGPALAAVYLGYPVLHDDARTQSMRDAHDPRLWNATQVRAMWSLYLGGKAADEYAAPGRVADVAGLPFTYVVIHGADPHRDEALDFVERLAQADVLVEAHLVPGAPHMADVYAPDAPVVRRSVAAWTAALGQALRS